MLRYVFGIAFLFLMVTPLSGATIPGDINNDGMVGLPEAIYALQCVSGIKTDLPTQEEVDQAEDAVNYAAETGAQSGESAQSAAELEEVISYLGLSEVQGTAPLQIAMALASGDFNCGTKQRNGSTVTYTFSGDPDCGSITGQIAVTPQISEGKISFNITYTHVSQGDCTINGSGTTSFTADGSQLIIRHQSDNLNVCGQQINGTTILTYNALSQTLVSTSVVGEYVFYDNALQVTAAVNMVYTTPRLNGTATVTADGQTYNCTFEDVTIDPVCGIPTAGGITVNAYSFDFSETTCENPTVTTTVKGIPVTLSLEDAMAL
jgi:hypothetical protein